MLTKLLAPRVCALMSPSCAVANVGRVSKMSNFTLQFIEQQKKDTLK